MVHIKSKIQIVKYYTIWLLLLLFISCQNDDLQPTLQEESPVNVIIDADLGSSTDDLFALMLLYRYADMGLANILAVIVDRPGEDCYAVADVMNTYYGYPKTPIGIVRGNYEEPKKYIDYAGMFAGKEENVKNPFPRTWTNPSLLPDGYKLYRQFLAKSKDKSVVILSVGFLLCLNDLINSKPDQYSDLSGKELLRRKVSNIYIMGGKFSEEEKACYNFRTFCEESYNFLTNIPSDIYVTFSPSETGDMVEYRPEVVLNDLADEPNNPIRLTYANYNCDTGQMMWDALVVINAIKGDALFDFSPWGNVTYDEKCITTFNTEPDGHCRYQMPQPDAGWSNRILDEIRRMNIISGMCSPKVPR